MRDHVRFTAPQLAPRKPEDAQVNPGVYGEEVARWLGGRLEAMGYAVSEPTGEDWGWLLEVSQGGARAYVGCGNVEGSRTEWLVWAEPIAGLLGKLLRRGNVDRVAFARLLQRIDAALRGEPGVAGIEWFRVDPRTGQEEDHAERPL